MERDFLDTTREFDSFIETARNDLSRKKMALKEQRKLILQRHSTLKNYLNCQVFMIGRHDTRLERFQAEIKMRAKAAEDRNLLPTETAQISADMSKMKTRCKHILDVTDRFCVLSVDELRLKTPEKKCSSIEDFADSSSSSSSSMSSSPIAICSSPAPSSTSSSVATTPNQLTEKVVKATLESFTCHLSVIAKTYTSRKGRRRVESSIQNVSSEEVEEEFSVTKDISDSASSLSV